MSRLHYYSCPKPLARLLADSMSVLVHQLSGGWAGRRMRIECLGLVDQIGIYMVCCWTGPLKFDRMHIIMDFSGSWAKIKARARPEFLFGSKILIHTVRPRAAGLLIGIECFRVSDSLWMYLTSFVNTRIGVELAAVQRKLPDCVVVEFQPYSARTFHVTLSPRYIRAGRDPLQIINN